MCSTMRGSTEMESALTGCSGKLSDDVALRPHLGRTPVSEPAIVHGESVVVFGYGDDVLGTGLLKEISPGIGIESLCLELRDEVLVSGPCLRSIGLDLMLK